MMGDQSRRQRLREVDPDLMERLDHLENTARKWYMLANEKPFHDLTSMERDMFEAIKYLDDPMPQVFDC